MWIHNFDSSASSSSASSILPPPPSSSFQFDLPLPSSSSSKWNYFVANSTILLYAPPSGLDHLSSPPRGLLPFLLCPSTFVENRVGSSLRTLRRRGWGLLDVGSPSARPSVTPRNERRRTMNGEWPRYGWRKSEKSSFTLSVRRPSSILQNWKC